MAVTGRVLQFERLTLFSDAVFAIAITLLIIEIRLPHFEGGDNALAQALADLIPNYIGFLVSFFVVGRFWIGHHTQFGLIDDFDKTLVWRNMLFLGAIAFMPFPTAVVVEHGGSSVAVIFYGCWLIVAGVLAMLLFRHVAAIAKARDGELSTEHRALVQGSWMPIAIGVTACVGALFHPLAGLAALTVSPLFMGVFQRLQRRRVTSS